MKSKFIIILCLINFFAKGQLGLINQDSLLLTQRTYYTTGPSGPGMGTQYFYQFHYYFINGDSINNNLTYKKLYYYSTPNSSNLSPPPINYNNLNFQSLVYQDSGKVFMGSIGSMTLIINYNLNLNDSFAFKTYNQKLKLQVIDSILLGSVYYKRFIFEKGIMWIKGIGDIHFAAHYNSYNFLNPSGVPNVWFGSELMCYSEKKVNIIGNFCSLTNLINDFEQNKTIFIFPNPTKNSITISQTDQIFKKYEIYTLNGTLISENKIQSKQQKVDLSGYAEGMYVVKLIGEQKVEFKKIVVIE